MGVPRPRSRHAAGAKPPTIIAVTAGPLGPLHGVPIGIKDIFDTGDMPTEFGTALWAGRTPRRDAAAVARLRSAGAVIMGKTVTTEYAYYHPGKTKNPHDPERTPGGSSSGSAAAVASHMVPGAIGSQTNGSVIRPAAFCGVIGFKPTHGLIPRSGALLLVAHARPCRRVRAHRGGCGAAGRSARGLRRGRSRYAPCCAPALGRRGRERAAAAAALRLRALSAWERAEPATGEAFAELVAALGEVAAEVDIGAGFDRAIDMHHTVMDVEMAHNLHRDYEKGADKLSAVLRKLIERGRTVPACDYMRAVAGIAPLNRALDALFDEYDAILTPAAPGEAPRGLDSTGNPVFCTIWTYLGTPAVTLPLLQGEAGMPLGVQLVARRGNDARLLRTASWLVKTIERSGRRRARTTTATARSDARRARKRSA